VTLAQLVGCWLLAGPALGAEAPSDASGQDLPKLIARFEGIDPDSPALLAARLEYADQLAAGNGGSGESCLTRLANAQSQLDVLDARPAFEILLPTGPARLASIEYQIHLARASCGSDAARRQTELRAALVAAQYAVGLYRDALDYRTMVVMQFNAAALQRMLGDTAAAIAALEAVITMDHECGFDEDAVDNERLLARWSGRSEQARQPDSPLPQLPAPSASLMFGWRASYANVRVEISASSLLDGVVTHVLATRHLQRHVIRTDEHNGWTVFYDSGELQELETAGLGLSSTTLLRGLAVPYSQALLLQRPDLRVQEQGGLIEVSDSQRAAKRMENAAYEVFRHHLASTRALSREEIDGLAGMFSPWVLETQAAEDYNFETAAWIGATLEQGVWYNTVAELVLPGIRVYSLDHDIEFAFTRRVACNPGGADRACIEIVVHASPQPQALEGLKSDQEYWSATYMRIIVDPITLTPHLTDTRRYWHFVAGPRPDQHESGSQRILSRFTY